ncbi:MAG TPA: GGDEF domain-containing phosphodiesterase [Rhodocyclaceae bacterium]|nr:GGDEF domain-containing phosphodiesterase [Rhodocyclaceae bacterium]
MQLTSIPARYQTPAAALFALLLGTAWLTAWGWKQHATGTVIERELQRNIAVATGLSNVLLPRYVSEIRRAARTSAAEVPKLEFQPALAEDVARQIRGQRVAKVQIDDPRGIVVFSTDAASIGTDQSGDEGIVHALRGEAQARLAEAGEAPRGSGDRDFVRVFVPSSPGSAEKQDAVFEAYADVTDAMVEVRNDARYIWAVANLAGLTVFGVALIILRRAEEAQRRKDSVTGLQGREGAVEALKAAYRDLGPLASPPRIGWLLVGVQRVRQVSAAYGHRAADAMLREIRLRLQALVDDESKLFRLGGEAFALLVVNREANGNDGALAERLARAAIKRFDAPIMVEGHAIVADVAVGVALGHGDDVAPEDLLNRAEVSLTEANRQGAGHWQLYVPGLEEGVRERLQSVGGLREALERKEFRVHYQPLVDAANRQLVGCEALVRWKHPTKGIIPPDAFISLLEETGLIIDVGMFVLKEACMQAMVWRQTLLPDFAVSVNLSARQFADPDLVKRIREALEQSGLPPSALIVEVTETSLAMEPEYAAGVLGELRKLGIAIAIDDFGVGYSSLSSLRWLPVDVLKIDRAFISQAPHDPVDAAIAHAIAALARGLNLTLVAEGVETEAHADFARSIGCDKLQGYLFARPLDPKAFEAAYHQG